MASKSSLSIRLTEPVVFLRGTQGPSAVASQPAMVRGLLTLTLRKPSRIKSIELRLDTRSSIIWPEGIGVRRMEIVEEHVIRSQRVVFFDATALPPDSDDPTLSSHPARRALSVGPGLHLGDEHEEYPGGAEREELVVMPQRGMSAVRGTRMPGYGGGMGSISEVVNGPAPPYERHMLGEGLGQGGMEGLSPIQSSGGSQSRSRGNSAVRGVVNGGAAELGTIAQSNGSLVLSPTQTLDSSSTLTGPSTISTTSLPSPPPTTRRAPSPSPRRPRPPPAEDSDSDSDSPPSAPTLPHPTTPSIRPPSIQSTSTASTTSVRTTTQPGPTPTTTRARLLSSSLLPPLLRRGSHSNTASVHDVRPALDSPPVLSRTNTAGSAEGVPLARTASHPLPGQTAPTTPGASQPVLSRTSSHASPAPPSRPPLSASHAHLHSPSGSSTHVPSHLHSSPAGSSTNVGSSSDGTGPRGRSRSRARAAIVEGVRKMFRSASHDVTSPPPAPHPHPHPHPQSPPGPVQRVVTRPPWGGYHASDDESMDGLGPVMNGLERSRSPRGRGDSPAGRGGSPREVERGRERGRTITRGSVGGSGSGERSGSVERGSRSAGSGGAAGEGEERRGRERERTTAPVTPVTGLGGGIPGQGKKEHLEAWREFRKGTYTYPIVFPVPAVAPVTVNTEFGSVKYYLSAVVHRAGPFNPRLTAEKEVEVIDVPVDEEPETVHIERQWEESLRYLIQLDNKISLVGGEIGMDLTLMPLEKVRIYRVLVELDEKIDYFSRGQRLTRYDTPKKWELLSLKSANKTTPLLPLTSLLPSAGPVQQLLTLQPAHSSLSEHAASMMALSGPWVLHETLKMPTCKMGVHRSTKAVRSGGQVKVSHTLKIVIRVERGEEGGGSKKWDIMVDTPVVLFDCRCGPAYTSLPTYNMLQPGSLPPSAILCACPTTPRGGGGSGSGSLTPVLNLMHTHTHGGSDSPKPAAPTLVESLAERNRTFARLVAGLEDVEGEAPPAYEDGGEGSSTQ